MLLKGSRIVEKCYVAEMLIDTEPEILKELGKMNKEYFLHFILTH